MVLYLLGYKPYALFCICFLFWKQEYAYIPMHLTAASFYTLIWIQCTTLECIDFKNTFLSYFHFICTKYAVRVLPNEASKHRIEPETARQGRRLKFAYLPSEDPSLSVVTTRPTRASYRTTTKKVIINYYLESIFQKTTLSHRRQWLDKANEFVLEAEVANVQVSTGW